MKKYIFISIVCFLLVSLIFAHQEVLQGPYTQLLLKGQLKGSEKGAPSQPIESFQNEDDLELYFLSSLNSLTIKVVNEQDQVVYQKTVNAVAGSSLIIELQGWASGAYTLVITDGLGGYLEGIFQIE